MTKINATSKSSHIKHFDEVIINNYLLFLTLHNIVKMIFFTKEIILPSSSLVCLLSLLVLLSLPVPFLAH